MKNKHAAQLSRRHLLQGGAVLLLGSWLRRFAQAEEGASAFFQVDRKRIYLAPDDHTDYFWLAGEADYQQAFLDMLDYYLDKVDDTAGNPADFQSRWNCDGSFWIWTYQQNRTTAQFQRLINRVKDGHISFPLNALVVCLGGAPAEAVLRGMYYAGSLERRYNLRIPVAIAMENQTLPYGLAALWAGSGAKYSWKGICNCDTAVSAAWDREHDIYWMTGPDGSQVLMKWNSMLVSNQAMGGYAEALDPAAIVDYVDKDTNFRARYPYRVIGAFGQGWDGLDTQDQQCVSAAQTKSNATRRVIVSNQQDFFEDFETTYGEALPSVSASFGNEWDLYCAALAEVSARVKRAVEKLRSAEALATLVSLQDTGFANDREAARDQAWMDLGLFWEHNFGMAYAPSGLVNERVIWQKRLASEIEDYTDGLYADAVQALGGMISKSGSQLRFYAFNPLSWERTDYADLPYTGVGPVHVFDLSTGLETPSQLVSINGQQYLRVLARAIPALGYKVFEVRTGAGQSFAGQPSADAGSGIMENDFYRATVAGRGALTSLVDKRQSNRQFTGNNGYSLNDLGQSSGSLILENAGPVSATLRATASQPLQHATRVTLFRSPINRIEIRNDIEENFDTTHTWRFGFNLSAPDVWHEEVGAVVRVKKVSQGGHYSSRAQNSRYDWLTLNHFADMSGSGDVGVTLSNADCYFIRLGNSTVSTLDTNTPQVSVLAGGRVVAGNNGLPHQGGDTHFLQRFALQTHGAYNQVAAMKFALEHQNPLVTGVVTGGTAYPETSYSLLTISNPNVLLWALKPSEEGIRRAIIARVWNLSAGAATFSLTLAGRPILYALRTTHIETPIKGAAVSDGALTANLNSQQLGTFSLGVFELEKVYLPTVLASA